MIFFESVRISLPSFVGWCSHHVYGVGCWVCMSDSEGLFWMIDRCACPVVAGKGNTV